ncbi:squamosa promoter-binding 9 [Chlorella sorokiniana]|uniref:Squamosa promoter-binding 9 n=1 Tax=Chlorella sorokiniana TaxID=3076 RepID=A0A2P6TPQ4_CHLSO|nr:squamosa promoter-binding 9 [Chlorella sorokiniana]|eukprot:PRW55998.1 squamosa promoter-binding 9 [Chlorella sorokiniana]
MPANSADSLAGSPASAAHSGCGGGSERTCQVPGCQATLGAGFYWKYRVCQPHSRAPLLVLEGVHKRFCQQCSKFHTLEAFDGERHSCRASLARHQQRRQRLRLQRAEEEEAQRPQPKRKRGAAAKGQAEEEDTV